MLPTQTGEPPVSMADEHKGSNAPVVRTALGIVPVAEPEMSQVIGPAVDQVGLKPIGPVAELAAGKLIVLAVGRQIGPAAARQIGPVVAVELRVQAVAEIRLVTALYPRVQRAEAAMP